MFVSITLTDSIKEAAARAGMEPMLWVKRAALRQWAIDQNPDIPYDLISKLELDAEGNYPSTEEVEALLAEFRGKKQS